MEKIAQFEKVSFEQFAKAWEELHYSFHDEPIQLDEIRRIYNKIKLPQRATAGSAGYDFYIPDNIQIFPQETFKIPTGIRAKIDSGWVLMIYPRSGLGFKYRLQLDNTVGVIDSDYYNSDNEGHIYIKITNDTLEGKIVDLDAGKGFAQGIFMPFGITKEDDVSIERNGGFGSTDR